MSAGVCLRASVCGRGQGKTGAGEEFSLKEHTMEPEFIHKTLGQVLEQLAQDYPQRNAVTYTDRDYKRSWKEFNEECDVIAKAFLALGIKKGDHIAIWATNVPQWLLTFFAAAKMGGVLVTVNTNYKVFELEYLLRQSDTNLLVMIDGTKNNDYVESINKLCPTLKTSRPGELNNPMLPCLKTVVYAGKGECPAGMVNWNDLYSLAESYPDAAYRELTAGLDCQDVVNMQYTSGTTGFPKGVMLTHFNILNNGKAIGDGMNFSKEDRLCITVPFFHCFGMVLGLMACITHAASVVPVEVYSPTKVMNAIMTENCTAVHGVPTMFIAMLEHPDFDKYSFARLRTGIMAGSPCPVKVMQDVIDKMGMKEIIIVFGQTEASPGCTLTSTTDTVERRVNTVGRAFPGVECKIVDPATGETVGPGVVGEFCARGYNIMKGYYKMPEATAMAIDKDGWLHLGDLAVADEQGYYKITGRMKDMIIRGGENIYPKELEDFLYTNPKVKDVQVIGVPSKQYGEEVMACVILKDGQSMTEEEVKDYFRASMSRHKVPRYVRFMEAFPMTASGKIQKFVLRDQAVELLSLQEDAAIVTA